MDGQTMRLLIASVPGTLVVTIATGAMDVLSLPYLLLVLTVGVCEWIVVMRVIRGNGDEDQQR
jgi:hypothetical protein